MSRQVNTGRQGSIHLSSIRDGNNMGNQHRELQDSAMAAYQSCIELIQRKIKEEQSRRVCFTSTQTTLILSTAQVCQSLATLCSTNPDMLPRFAVVCCDMIEICLQVCLEALESLRAADLTLKLHDAKGNVPGHVELIRECSLVLGDCLEHCKNLRDQSQSA